MLHRENSCALIVLPTTPPLEDEVGSISLVEILYRESNSHESRQGGVVVVLSKNPDIVRGVSSYRVLSSGRAVDLDLCCCCWSVSRSPWPVVGYPALLCRASNSGLYCGIGSCCISCTYFIRNISYSTQRGTEPTEPKEGPVFFARHHHNTLAPSYLPTPLHASL